MKAKAEKRAIGRPSKFTPALFEEICTRLGKGEPLAAICRDAHMPDPSTVHDWRNGDAALSQRFARAREDGFDAIALEALQIADDSRGDVRIVGDDEREVCNTEFVQRSKLRVETRLKLLAKWDPKRYGDRVQQEISGADGAPLGITVQFVKAEAR